MAQILNDKEIKRLIGKVIVNGDSSCIRPNSYILRLGSEGEFMTTNKEFELGKTKKGIILPPGNSVGVTAFETLDFKRETLDEFFTGYDLHAIVSPSTDLSREGIVAPTTQVDAGFKGTLNWTLTNTSSQERRFVYMERIYRITFFLLDEGEKPENLYDGDYQEKTGYIRSRRSGAPVGMKENEWEAPNIKGGPEELLENLIKSGYPWHILGSRLKQIDQQFKAVSDEYANIYEALGNLSERVDDIRNKQNNSSEVVRKILREEASSIQNRWLIGSSTVLLGLIGIILSVVSNQSLLNFFTDYGVIIGISFIIVSVIVFIIINRQK